MITKEEVARQYQEIQDEICAGLEQLDGKAKFVEEKWEREGGGGGRTRVIQDGNVLEKGGVNFSAVDGLLPDTLKNALKVNQNDFFATGVSIVIHPNHPMVPIIHMNIRFFEMPAVSGKPPVRWFGGGIDLTPHYVIDEDAKFFHGYLKATCDKFSAEFYTRFKKWADDYFFIKHRDETRGIGGIFYDALRLPTNYHGMISLNFPKPLVVHSCRYIPNWLTVIAISSTPKHSRNGNTNAAAAMPSLTSCMMPVLNSVWKQMAVSNPYS